MFGEAANRDSGRSERPVWKFGQRLFFPFPGIDLNLPDATGTLSPARNWAEYINIGFMLKKIEETSSFRLELDWWRMTVRLSAQPASPRFHSCRAPPRCPISESSLVSHNTITSLADHKQSKVDLVQFHVLYTHHEHEVVSLASRKWKTWLTKCAQPRFPLLCPTSILI
jgi:hypothetical protein